MQLTSALLLLLLVLQIGPISPKKLQKFRLIECLFLRDCDNHLADLGTANRHFWAVRCTIFDEIYSDFQLMAMKKVTIPTRVEVYMESQCPDTTR